MHWTQHPRKKPGLYQVVDGKVQWLDSFKHDPNYNYVMDGSPTGGPKPGLRSPWYDSQCRRKGSSRAIAMDLDINPSGSMSQFFDALVIHQLRVQYACAPYWEGDVIVEGGRVSKLLRRVGGPLKLWCHLDSNMRPPKAPYGAGADLSTGSGATNSCLTFINAWLGEKVLEYADPRIQPHELAPIAVALCWWFRNEGGDGAYFAWEHVGPGLPFAKGVLDLGYDNIYYRTAELPHSHANVRSKNPGWFPNVDTKRVLLEEYRTALSSRRLTNRSDEALKECLAFRYNDRGDPEHSGEVGGDDPTGARVNHGDRVIADALAWKMACTFSSRQKVEEAEPWAHLTNPYNSLAFRRKVAEHDEDEARSVG